MGGVRTWQATIEDNRALLTSAGCCQPPRQAASRPARVRSSRACVEPPACLPKLQLRLGHLLVRPARDRRFPSHGGPSRAGDGQLPEQCSCPIPMPVTVRAERVRIACFRHHTAHRPRSAWSRLPRCWASTSPSVRPSAPKAVGAPQHQLPAAPGHGCSPGAAPRVAGRQAPLLPGGPGLAVATGHEVTAAEVEAARTAAPEMGLVPGRRRVHAPAHPTAAEPIKVVEGRGPALDVAVPVQPRDPELRPAPHHARRQPL